MILPALIDYYERLKADPEKEVAPFGFSSEKISFCIVLNPDGTLADAEELDDVRREEGGKRRPRSMIVPDRGGRSGAGVKPNFLWDNTGYELGRDGKEKPERAQTMFEAFRELHQKIAKRVDDAGLHALCRFLENWTPQRAESFTNWEDICDSNLVFRLRGEQSYVHESPGLQGVWLKFVNDEGDSERGCSLISGVEDDIARLHPPIRGVAGAQTTGAALASFNCNAFESYGKEQTFNAPVSVSDAFRYATALNRLLADDRRRVRIGDATVVFWAGKPTPFEDFFGSVIAEPAAEDMKTNDRLREFLARFKQGRLGDVLDDEEVPFYVLGLSPNMSRLSIRFWLSGSVRQFVDRLDRHARDLGMTGARTDDPPLTIHRLLWETAREPKDVSPVLAGEVARSILAGSAYPHSLFASVIRRVRADGQVNHRRAAILKACITRQARVTGQELEVPVSLNVEHPDPAYHMGRLFAALEKIQEDALGTSVGASVKDRYFGSASATPAMVFPRLLRLSQHHLGKLDPGWKVNREKLLQEICSRIAAFPSHLPLQSQGLLQIAYYHQRQAFFEKKDRAVEKVAAETTE